MLTPLAAAAASNPLGETRAVGDEHTILCDGVAHRDDKSHHCVPLMLACKGTAWLLPAGGTHTQYALSECHRHESLGLS